MALSKKNLRIGDVFQECVVENLTQTQIVQYAGASGDFNPVHTDWVYATQAAGLETVFAHGLLSAGATARMITDYVGDGRLTRYGVRFMGKVFPGDSLHAKATVTNIRGENGENYVDLEIVTVNQKGEVAIKGYATARIDP